MDERTIKRLLIILVASIIAIMLIKMALTKTYTTLNNAATVKKQASPAKPVTPQQAPASAVITDIPATSGVVDATTMESPAASSVSETR